MTSLEYSVVIILTAVFLQLWRAMNNTAVQGCKRDLGVQDRDETETFDFQSETRPRPSHTLPRPRRDRDV